MYAYVRNGVVDSYSEELFQKHVPASTEETEDGLVEIPEVPGLVYDEAIEYDFDETPVLEDGKIVPYSESRKKTEDDQRKADEEASRKEARKSEIRAEIGLVAKERDGLVELWEDAEAGEIQKRIDELKDEYASLN